MPSSSRLLVILLAASVVAGHDKKGAHWGRRHHGHLKRSSAAKCTSTAGNATTSAVVYSASSSNSTDSTSSSRDTSSSSSDSSLFPSSFSLLESYTASPVTSSSLSGLSMTSDMTSLSHPIDAAPDGTDGIHATYGAGTYTLTSPHAGGFSFYLTPPLTTAREVLFTYSVYFPSSFDWNLGGKLPGIFGGDTMSGALSCSGGRQSGRDTCFSVRLMWRAEGAGEVYVYLPQDEANTAYCNEGSNHCNSAYGDSLGRGAFTFTKGGWTEVTQRVRLNTPGSSDGEIELFVGGKSVISQSNVVIRTKDAGVVRGLMMQTFFGGGTAQYASPSEQNSWFKDLGAAITESL